MTKRRRSSRFKKGGGRATPRDSTSPSSDSPASTEANPPRAAAPPASEQPTRSRGPTPVDFQTWRDPPRTVIIPSSQSEVSSVEQDPIEQGNRFRAAHERAPTPAASALDQDQGRQRWPRLGEDDQVELQSQPQPRLVPEQVQRGQHELQPEPPAASGRPTQQARFESGIHAGTGATATGAAASSPTTGDPGTDMAKHEATGPAVAKPPSDQQQIGGGAAAATATADTGRRAVDKGTREAGSNRGHKEAQGEHQPPQHTTASDIGLRPVEHRDLGARPKHHGTKTLRPIPDAQPATAPSAAGAAAAPSQPTAAIQRLPATTAAAGAAAAGSRTRDPTAKT